jgi:hypothetical protein
MPNHYDPTQPRVPAGHHDGGQWTSGGQAGEPTLQLAFFDPRRFAAQKVVEGTLALFAWWSARNSADRRAVLDFRAREYLRSGPDSFDEKNVRLLDRDEVGDICYRLKDVQNFTDLASATVLLLKPDLHYWDPVEYGTRVHANVAQRVWAWSEAHNDPNFDAEESMRKIKEEVPAARRPEPFKKTRRGEPGEFIRVDVFENIPDKKTVCVYDIKTGKRGLDKPRMDEIVRAVLNRFDGAIRIVITQIRPGQG